ncbi:hypothetical protein F4803DRAFT_507800 [Xylaria telfairii]|nr:hypothetical protein F4803DRAFT_507800 [Xylaria telfairii]
MRLRSSVIRLVLASSRWHGGFSEAAVARRHRLNPLRISSLQLRREDEWMGGWMDAVAMVYTYTERLVLPKGVLYCD